MRFRDFSRDARDVQDSTACVPDSECPVRPVDGSAKSRAFTAIELLVVIAIILILAGILVPVLTGIRERARRQLAATKLKGICIALDRYFLDLGCYPPDTGPLFGAGLDKCQDSDSTTDDEYSLYKYLCGKDGEGLYRGSRAYGPYIQFEDSELKGGSGAADEKTALDPWGTPWIYEEHHSISLQKTPPPGWWGHKRKRYDVYSVGPDRVLDETLHDGIDNDNDGLLDEADEARFDGRDNDADGTVDDGNEVGDDITNW